MIYFLRFPSGMIKIGSTTNLKTRLAAICRDPLYGPHELLKVIPGDKAAERQLHRRFSAHRVSHPLELFDATDDLMAFIENPDVSPLDPETHAEPQNIRRCTLSLSDEIWEQLQAIERRTGARPSVTVRRILQQSLGRRRKGNQPPAA